MIVVSKKLKLIVAVVFVLLTAFFVSGYWLSDDRYFDDLIVINHLETPEDALAFVNKNTDFNQVPDPIPFTTPRFMLQRRHLWCDESAMLLATLVQRLGYETRLVDIINEKGIAGHTYLQIYENGEWKNYDTAFLKKSGLTHEQILEGYSYANLKGYPSPRPYPRLYNRIIQSNFYFKQIALWLRNVPG